MSPSPVSDDDAKAALRRAQRDPVWWVKTWLGREPWAKQAEILEAVRDHPRVAVRSCHGAGKSWTGAAAVLWFLYSHPDSIVITTAPTGRQVRKILWAEIAAAHSAARARLGGRLLTTEIQISEKWFAFGFATDDGDSFQGPHSEHVLAVVDEASGVEQAILTAVDGVLSSEHCRLLEIGNPTDPDSPFAAEFKNPGAKKLAVSAFDTPNFTRFKITEEDVADGTWESKVDAPLPYPALVTPAWVADKHRRWGPKSPLYVARVKGDFPQDASDALISLAWIEAAKARELPPGDPSHLGVDVARFGDDEIVIGHRRGPVYRTVSITTKEDTMRTTGRVAAALKETGATAAKIDDIGVGGGVTDRGRELRLPFVPVNVGEQAADKEKFANLRAELWWGLRERYREGHIDMPDDDDELEAQLASIRYEYTSRGQIKIESKDDAKKRGLRSPDRAEAEMLAFANVTAGPDYEVLSRL